MTPEEREAALARFIDEFEIVPTSLIDPPSNLSMIDQPRGDCQDFGRTVKEILGVKFPRAIMIRCWSPQNFKAFPFVPRHAVMCIKGRGCIDSTYRDFRKTPLPCIPAWPVGTLVVVGLTLAARAWGLW